MVLGIAETLETADYAKVRKFSGFICVQRLCDSENPQRFEESRPRVFANRLISICAPPKFIRSAT